MFAMQPFKQAVCLTTICDEEEDAFMALESSQNNSNNWVQSQILFGRL